MSVVSGPSRVYSSVADVWSSPSVQGAQRRLATARRVVRALRSGGSVLDVGCGAGTHLALIRTEARRAGKRVGRLAGLDLAPAMVETASRRPRVRAALGDALELPFRDQVFDVVLANRVLHLVDDPARAAREMVRVTLPGGTVIAEMWAAGPSPRQVERITRRLPEDSLLRHYLEVPRRYQVAAVRRGLESFGCEITEWTIPPREASADGRFLARIARTSGTIEDLAIAAELERNGSAPRWGPVRVVMARLPGPRNGGMPIRVAGLNGLRITPERVRRAIADLPKAHGYEVLVKPLRYRTRPHVQAFCEFDRKRITIQVPVPFRAFTERVPYRAQRIRSRGLRFRWYERRLRFERPDELIRYLYLHEYYHWYLREVLGRPSAAETACDRFALQRL